MGVALLTWDALLVAGAGLVGGGDAGASQEGTGAQGDDGENLAHGEGL
jgi:hypothetical protein